MTVAPDAIDALVGVYGTLNRPTPEAQRVRLRGLDAEREYRVTVWPDRPGDPLAGGQPGHARRRGPPGQRADPRPPRHEAARLGDFWSRLFVLEAV